MASPVEIISVTVAITSGIVIPLIILWTARVNRRRAEQVAKVDILEAKVEKQNEIIDELRRQNSELKVTSQIVNRLFTQVSSNEIIRELEP